jgi:hypothetical protein
MICLIQTQPETYIKPEKGERGEKGEKGDKGDKGDMGQKGESCTLCGILKPIISNNSFFSSRPSFSEPHKDIKSLYSNKRIL